MYDISTINITCTKCDEDYPKNNFLELSPIDKTEFEKQAHLLRTFYEQSLKTTVFHKRLKRERQKKGKSNPTLVLKFIPENYVFINFLIALSQKFSKTPDTLLRVIENIDFSDKERGKVNCLNCIIETCVFPLYECARMINAYETGERLPL